MIHKDWEVLYTLDTAKKIRVFKCRVEEDDFDFLIITLTGLLGGKLIEKIERVKAGKNINKANETTPLAQTLLQADSLWRKKWNKGYKSEKHLKNALNPTTEAVDQGTTIDVINQANKYLPNWWYTNENWDELPMLATPQKKIKKIEFPAYIQPKYNGVRCLAKYKDGRIVLISRGGTYYKIPHLEKQIWELTFPIKNIILDGELYKHGANLQDISGAARTEEDGKLFGSNDWLEYHVYDAIDTSLPELNNISRESLLKALKDVNDSTHIKFVKTNIALDKLEIKENHDQYIEEGYEGAIVRIREGKYEFNTRSKSLIKVKEFIDEEFQIIGFSADVNKSIEESFVFKLKNNIDNQVFLARPTGTAAQKRIWYENIDAYIGDFATVRFQERSTGGLPIQGHVRSDLTEVLHIRPSDE